MTTADASIANRLHPDRRALLWLNVLGGLAVLGSYAFGLGVSPALRTGLWGGVPESLRPLYTVNMWLAAAGYFGFSSYLFFRVDPDRARLPGGRPYRDLLWLYGLILIPSALWLPLTWAMLANPSALLWLAIRLDLALVGLGSLGVLVACVSLRRQAPGVGQRVAVVSALPFCLQTAVLDALIWPAWFPT